MKAYLLSVLVVLVTANRNDDSMYPWASRCHIWGDPHYTTFDGTGYFDYMGPCEYYVVKACNSFPGGNNLFPPYAQWFITAKHEFSNKGSATNIQYITIHLPGAGKSWETIDIGKCFGKCDDNGINVEINNVDLHTPSIPCKEGGITYQPFPDFEFCMTDARGYLQIVNKRLGLVIHYRYQGLKIWLDDKMYSGHMCGLCGYFDGNPDNEYRLGPNKHITKSITKFGDYYELPGCTNEKKEAAVSGPKVKEEDVQLVKHLLTMIINSNAGKSSGCSDVMKSDSLDTYAYDVVACGGADKFSGRDSPEKRKCFCDVLEKYFAECDDRMDSNRPDRCAKITWRCPNVYNRQYCTAKCPPARYLRNCKPGSCKKGYNCKMEIIKNCPHYQCVECGRDGNRNCRDDKME